MSIILGMHYGHDGAAAIVKRGRLVAALASERTARQKKHGGVEDATLDAVLAEAGITVDDIDAVTLTDWSQVYCHNGVSVYAADERFTNPEGFPVKPGGWVHDSWDRIWDDEVWTSEVELRGRRIPGFHMSHQKAHCASAFYTSPYDEAWCISMDSSGAKPKNNYTTCRGSGRELTTFDTELCLIGIAYDQVCRMLGIGEGLHKAGSLMALASYGKPLDHILGRINCFKRYPFHRQDDDYHKWLRDFYPQLFGGKTFTPETSDTQEAMDIAASIQYVFEEAVLHAVNSIPDDGCNNLCLSGGSFLNCTVNTRIRKETRFNDVWHFPGCGDDGLAVGSALFVAHSVSGHRRVNYRPKDAAYLGPKGKEGKQYDYAKVAKAIANGAVVAWFQGRSEYGPRALGNRSLLADPRIAANRERINHEIKHREWFRPLSPSVLAEKSREWFDFEWESPFMLYTAKCLQPERVPAVVHVDGTSRMQTVREKDNPHYYRLIQAFEVETGVPMVLNTSLNVDGQPILETEQDMRDFWERVPVDMAVVNGEVWER